MTPTAVVGDGTTAPSRMRSRWRRARWTVLVLVLLVLVVAALAATRPPVSGTPYAPDAATMSGARALAQVLGHQGVTVHHVTTVDDAVRAAGPGTTLLVTPAPLLSDEQAATLATLPADLVLVGPGGTLLERATDGRVAIASFPPAGSPEPGCDVPAARAAGRVDLDAALAVRDTTTAACWTADLADQEASGNDDPVAVMARLRVHGRTVTAVGDPTFLRNTDVTTQGNAALALWLLGENDKLVWFVQDPLDASAGTEVRASPGVVPSWLGTVSWWALLCVVVAALWRARRLGPLVTEELPVTVPAAEVVRGRGRLYRRSGDRAHAARALRAATARRAAARIGVPHAAPQATLVESLARAADRDPQAVADLLFGPTPTDDAGLGTLARRLDELENEVHRP